DGNIETRWASASSDPQWIYFDLGIIKQFNLITIQWETAYGKEYEIQISNNAQNWKTVFKENNGDGYKDKIFTGEQRARYIRLYGIKRGTEWGYSIYEFKIEYDNEIPLKPSGISVQSGDSALFIDWNDNVENDLIGYNIYRSSEKDGKYKKINEHFVTGSRYIDRTVENKKRYYYYVQAMDYAWNNSRISEKVSAIPESGGSDFCATIRIKSKELGKINPVLCGSQSQEFRGGDVNRTGSRFGWGVWDSIKGHSIQEVINLGKDAGLRTLRLIGMWHKWIECVRIPGKTRRTKFGVDEWMEVCRQLGVEPIICYANIEYDDITELLGLIEYLNKEADLEFIDKLKSLSSGEIEEKREEIYRKYVLDRNGKIKWPNLRALNGKIEPYKAKYLEFGNETYLLLTPQQYVSKYLPYYEKIKKIDPDILIGAPLDFRIWSEAACQKIKEKIDFGVIHIYGFLNVDLSKISVKDMFRTFLASPGLADKRHIQDILRILEKNSGKKIPVFITEFNSGLMRPDIGRHYFFSLGNALGNAELYKTFMYLKENIITTNYFWFINGYYGFIANCPWRQWEKPENLYNPYYKRPNYYVFEFYNKHFGDYLLDTEVNCEEYDFEKLSQYLAWAQKRSEPIGPDLLKDIEWQVWDLPGVKVTKGPVLRIDFDNLKDNNYYHTFKYCPVEPNTFYRISVCMKSAGLNMPIGAPGFNIDLHENVEWKDVEWTASTGGLSYDSDEWIYTEGIFPTFDKTKELKINIRKFGHKLPLKGTIWVKDLKLQKVKPESLMIPYLSVNASKSKDGKKVYLIVINKNLDEDIDTNIIIDGFKPQGTAHIRTLWSDKIDATNEEGNHDNVKVYEEEMKYSGNKLKINFKKHSLTAVELY
ncbi:MAG: discoidin domain-containing protein, partial [Elusimicrobia bacterium]|nr:discoidin domain-containing protein [Elusimicrobiota bacterium]